MKKKLFLAGAITLLASVVTTGFSYYNQLNVSDLLNANIEALANEEGLTNTEGSDNYGWLWQKHWVDCSIISQVIVTQGSGSISAGVYYYSASLVAELNSSHATYTLVDGGAGQKSYCYDGWSFCSSNDCR